MAKPVKVAFGPQVLVVPIASILPLKHLDASRKSSHKFQQILSSVRELGLVEPLIIYPQNGHGDKYLLIDGHSRLEALKQLGHTEARCLISNDDEAYTYNKRVNQFATI